MRIKSTRRELVLSREELKEIRNNLCKLHSILGFAEEEWDNNVEDTIKIVKDFSNDFSIMRQALLDCETYLMECEQVVLDEE